MKLHLPLPVAPHCSTYHLNHLLPPPPWKNCLPGNQSQCQKGWGLLFNPLSFLKCLCFPFYGGFFSQHSLTWFIFYLLCFVFSFVSVSVLMAVADHLYSKSKKNQAVCKYIRLMSVSVTGMETPLQQ